MRLSLLVIAVLTLGRILGEYTAGASRLHQNLRYRSRQPHAQGRSAQPLQRFASKYSCSRGNSVPQLSVCWLSRRECRRRHVPSADYKRLDIRRRR